MAMRGRKFLPPNQPPREAELPQRALLLPALDGPTANELAGAACDTLRPQYEMHAVHRWLGGLSKRVRDGEVSIESALMAAMFIGENREGDWWRQRTGSSEVKRGPAWRECIPKGRARGALPRYCSGSRVQHSVTCVGPAPLRAESQRRQLRSAKPSGGYNPTNERPSLVHMACASRSETVSNKMGGSSGERLTA